MSDSLETAVIAMVLQGDALASQKAKQVTSDLSSAERAGRSAEASAKNAEGAVKNLGEQVREVTHKLHLAISVAERLAKAGGIESPALGAAGNGLSTFIATNRALSFLGPELSVPIAAAAGIFTGVADYQAKTAEEEKKAHEQADRIVEKLEERERKRHEGDVAAEIVRQYASGALDNSRGPRTIR